MLVNNTNLKTIFVSLQAKFQGAFKKYTSLIGPLYMVLPSTTLTNTYGWMADIPDFREWVGERTLHNLSTRSMSLTNKDYELTLTVKKNQIEDDNLGLTGIQAEVLGAKGAALPDKLVAKALLAGESTICYDGQYAFDTDHPVSMDDASKGVWSNLYTSTALSATNVNVVRTAMSTRQNEHGEIIAIRPTHLIVPPQLEETAKKIVVAEYLANGESNVNKGTLDILVLAELAGDATSWYMADLSQPIKPFIFQNRQAVEFTARTDIESDNVFHRKEFEFGADARGVAAPGFVILMAKCKA